MARQFDRIEDDHRAFIEAQHIFFVATAAPEGRVNLSPKGMDSLRVLGENRIVWLNLTGSGNETAAHLKRANRMTLMWAGFETRPLILRAYGSARLLHPGDPGWEALPEALTGQIGARQVFDLRVEMVQTSCGYGVPYFDYRGERDALEKWAQARGEEGLRRYWHEENARSIDGFATDFAPAPPPEDDA